MFVAIAIVLLLVLFPIYWMIVTSLKIPRDIYRLPSLWPKTFTFENYRILIEDKGFLLNIGNSLLVSLTVTVIAVLWFNREKLALPPLPAPAASTLAVAEGRFAFLSIPAVWMCFGFFFFYAMVISVVQAFAPEAARHLHGVPLALGAVCLTAYMVSAAGGMVLGGFLAADPSRCERIVGAGFGIAALITLVMALADFPPVVVPVLFGLMGFASGIAGPSRDLIVKRSTPANASGRVYGVVYAGLDIGQAVAPLIFGRLMDHGQHRAVVLGLAVVQAVLIASAFNVRRARRELLPAPAASASA